MVCVTSGNLDLSMMIFGTDTCIGFYRERHAAVSARTLACGASQHWSGVAALHTQAVLSHELRRAPHSAHSLSSAACASFSVVSTLAMASERFARLQSLSLFLAWWMR